MPQIDNESKRMEKEELQKIWNVELDLLIQFIRVCKKYNLQYYLSGGTLLGCIRHGGFIPWDDDIDIDMPRKDYEKLCSVASMEFQYPYFWQTASSDPGYFSGHAKLRNSNTLCIIPEDMYFCYNKGIFIDIFPLDNLPDSKIKRWFFCHMVYILKTIIIFGSPAYQAYSHKLLSRICRPVCKLIYEIKTLKSLSNKYDCLCMHYEGTETKFFAPISAFPLRKAAYWRKELYCEIVKKSFENIDVYVPEKYHDILSQLFGNYMNPLQIESNHRVIYFNAEVSDNKRLRGSKNELFYVNDGREWH